MPSPCRWREDIAPFIYEQAIHDAHVHLQDKLLDMEAILRLNNRTGVDLAEGFSGALSWRPPGVHY